MTLSHNATGYAEPLFFNETMVLAFQSVYHIPYSLPITYVWSVNGEKVDQSSSRLDYYFGEGTYTVTVDASYKIARCDPCTSTRSISLTVDGMSIFKLFFFSFFSATFVWKRGGVTTAPADPAMQGATRVWGPLCQPPSPVIFFG